MTIISLNIKDDIKTILNSKKIIEKFSSKSKFVCYIIRKYNKEILKLKLPETIDNIKKTLNIDSKMVKQQLDEKSKIQRDLFKWVWKEFKRSKEDKVLYIKFLELKIKENENNNLKDWIKKQILFIQSENWEGIDVDIDQRERGLLIHLLIKKGYTGKQAQKIVDGIRFVEKREQYAE